MTKLDLTQVYKSYYSATLAPQLVTIEKGLFITITGQGDPSGEGFSEAVGALYTVAYGIKAGSKQAGRDFTVSKLEGFWWVLDSSVNPLLVPREQWHYELAIRLPDDVTQQQFASAVITVEKKKKSSLFRQVDYKEIAEGRCIQILHVGPYSEEPVSLRKMDTLMQRERLTMNGRHHEIYLSDFRKTAPEKLKTILRHPVK
ncbi:GyrI-like domain-containing protein [Chitinophaga sp. MM2321]|uniref:GyrI-like domain-containing protein n=1 Tax=Chitinophaga sp. MM2321 TaxID=3137178 RepID=UPI0032D58140